MEKNSHVESQRIFNLIILDESGSMQRIEKQAVSGLNETFQTIINAQKKHREQRHYISFVTFNGNAIRTVMNRLPVDVSKKLRWKDYEPDDCTPLFDAMGRSINELRKCVEENDVVLVTIITDGYENASREYSGREIKRLVSEQREKGWVFAYIGTNQDVDAVADDMGIRSRMHYEYSDLGASEMFRTESRSKREFYARLHREGRNFMKEECYDYFESNNQDEDEPEKEPDITWDVNDDSSSSQIVDNSNDDKQDEEAVSQQQEDTQSVETTEEPEEPKGFWKRVMNILKG